MRSRGVPEVIGGQIALRLRGDQFARDRVDLVELVDDGDLAAIPGEAGSSLGALGVRGSRRRAGAAARGRGSETVMSAVAAGPRLPAPSTARTDELDRRAGGQFQVAKVHLDPRRPPRRPAGSARAATARPSSVTKKPSVPAGPSSRGVTHETSASPAGKSAVRGSTAGRSGPPAAGGPPARARS